MKKIHSLKFKLLYLSVAISLLLAIFLTVFEIKRDIREHGKIVEKELDHFAVFHLSYISSKVWSMEFDDLNKYAVGEIGEQWYDNIKIFDIKRTAIVDVGIRHKTSISKEFDLTYLHNAKNIIIGKVIVSGRMLDFKSVFQKRWKYTFFLNAISVIFIFACLYMFFNKMVLSRIEKINNAIELNEQIQFSDPQALLPNSTHPDEIDLLSNALGKKTSLLAKELSKRKDIETELENQNLQLKKEIKIRKDAEKSLKFQALLLDQIQDHVVATDLDGKITYVNSSSRKSIKRKEDEIIGNFVDLYGEDPQRGATQQQIIESTIKKGKWHGEIVNTASDGTKMIMDLRVKLINDEFGNPISMVGVSTDITERKESEAEKELLLTAIEQSPETIVITDSEGDIQYANYAFEKLTGFSRKNIIGKNPKVLKSGEHDQEFYTKLWSTILRGNTWKGNLTNRKKDGTLFTEEATISPVHNSVGEIVNFVAVKRDITNELKMKNQLDQMQKMQAIGNLAGGIAHDFNNILFPIIGMSELLLEDLPKGSLESDHAQEINRAGMRAKDLVSQILSFSRQSESEMIPVRVQNILKEVIKLCRSTIPSNIDIEQNIQQDCGSILANATQIHQIGMNLITNAYHAVEDINGKISVTLREVKIDHHNLIDLSLRTGRYIELSVADNGIGIPLNIKNKIFEPYFTTKVAGKGTGLGLAVVYGIIKEHKGDIQVDSEVGEGTTFKIYLPLMKNSEDIESKDLHIKNETGNEHILLVDDEPPIAKLEQRMIERLGYKITVRTSSMEALEVFKVDPNQFDMVLTDMSMPHMTGDQLAGEMKKIRPDIPIIICTGFSERINTENAEEVGVNAFLMKPIVKTDMAKTIRRVLDEELLKN